MIPGSGNAMVDWCDNNPDAFDAYWGIDDTDETEE
jgi:hypothetical protein